MDKFNIVLTSNGFNNSLRSEEIDILFKEITENKKVLIIANATKTGHNVRSRKDAKENLERVGARVVDVIEIDNNNLRTIFDYDVLYVMGGDIKPLLEDFQEINFRDYLLRFLQTGIYIGESAGSIVLCDNVKWRYDIKKGSKPMYDSILNSYEGLGITKRNIYPHFNEVSDEMYKKIKEYEKQNNIIITPLYEGEFILEHFI